VNANVWAAIGQVGAFVVAMGALIVALVSRKEAKRSAAAAEASAQAAQDAVQEARRANDLTESERREQARAQLARAQHEADLVRGAITIDSGNQVSPDRTLVGMLRVTVENHSTQPAIDVMYRHAEHRPEFALLDRAIRPEGQQNLAFSVEPRFVTLNDSTELIRGTEIKYKLGGVEWIRRGNARPVRV
jgi:chromosome segregation ATPase